jgi:hypothetical protein
MCSVTLQTFLKKQLSHPKYPALNNASKFFLNGGDLDFDEIERKLMTSETIRTSKDDACAKSYTCFSKETLNADLQKLQQVKELVAWYDWSGFMVPVEKAEQPTTTTSSPSVPVPGPKAAPLQNWVDLMEEEETDPMQNDFELENESDVETEQPICVEVQPVPQIPEPEKKPEPCCCSCCSNRFPLPPPGAKKGYKTRVCTQMPKHNTLSSGRPCTFPGVCSFAHSKEEAAFYTAYWADPSRFATCSNSIW